MSKDAPKDKREAQAADMKNMVFSSTYVTYGKGRAVVTATGMDTEVGKIAAMIAKDEKMKLLCRRDLTERKNTRIICNRNMRFDFIIGVIRKYGAFEMFMTSISLAVAAIPEGLPAIVTIVLAIGMQAMSKKYYRKDSAGG